MKKLLFLLMACAALCLHSCKEVEVSRYTTYEVSVLLDYPEIENEQLLPAEGVKVLFTNKINSTVFDALTDANGKLTTKLPGGIYDIAVSEQRRDGQKLVNINGNLESVEVAGSVDLSGDVSIELVASWGSDIVIKELYFGGCPTDSGSGSFNNGAYVILYNNSEIDKVVGNIGLATADPANSTSDSYYVDGKLTYTSWIPSASGFWTFKDKKTPTLKPGEEVVIALSSAVDNTKTYSQAINFANSSYYACYDPECGFVNASMYPVPAPEITSAQYMKGYQFGLGNAWVMSVSSPAFYIFEVPEDVDGVDMLQAFIDDDRNWAKNTKTGARELPIKWIFDGIDIFRSDRDANYKRLTAQIDAGSINFLGSKGYTVYRNVNKEATEAIPGNEGKLVYGYTLGTDGENGSTDPSGIDAEASIKNGARIIYTDTNNSTNDFHQRSRASLRDK